MMEDTPRRGARVATAVVEDTDAPACTPPADRGSESEGAGAGAKHRAQAPLMTSPPRLPGSGCAPGIDGSACPAESPPGAPPAWWGHRSARLSVGEPPDPAPHQVQHAAPPPPQ